MSSVFGSASAICADYFGDEYGVPLLSSTIKKTGGHIAKESENSERIGHLASKSKNGDSKPSMMPWANNKEGHVSPAPVTFLDGLHMFFEINF